MGRERRRWRRRRRHRLLPARRAQGLAAPRRQQYPALAQARNARTGGQRQRRLVDRRDQASTRRLLPHRPALAARHARGHRPGRRAVRQRLHPCRLGSLAARRPRAAPARPGRPAPDQAQVRQPRRWPRLRHRRLHPRRLHRPQLLGPGLGQGRPGGAALQRLAGQRDGLLGHATGRGHRRARGDRRGHQPAYRRQRQGRGFRQSGAGCARAVAVHRQHGEQRPPESARPVPHPALGCGRPAAHPPQGGLHQVGHRPGPGGGRGDLRPRRAQRRERGGRIGAAVGSQAL